MSLELWEPIEEFPNYSISNRGRVRNLRDDRYIQPHVNNSGHLYVPLWKDGLQKNRTVSKLVAETYVPKFKYSFPGNFDTVLYLDNDLQNVNYNNLTWRPKSFVYVYRSNFNRKFNYKRGPFEVIETGEIFDQPKECSIRFGVLEYDVDIRLFEIDYEGKAQYSWVWPISPMTFRFV